MYTLEVQAHPKMELSDVATRLRAVGLAARTSEDYAKHLGYFVRHLDAQGPPIALREVTETQVRDYILADRDWHAPTRRLALHALARSVIVAMSDRLSCTVACVIYNAPKCHYYDTLINHNAGGAVMVSAVREQIDHAQVGTWFRPADMGGGNATEQALLRLARDPASSVVRAAQGLYFKSGAPDLFFGKRKPAPIEVAKRVAGRRGVGPAGVTAAAYLGLTSQVAPRLVLTIVGTPPAGVSGVSWQVRKNPLRAQLNFTEVAIVELLALFPYGSEAEWGAVVERIAELCERNKVSIHRIKMAVDEERRKPTLKQNLKRLITDLQARR